MESKSPRISLKFIVPGQPMAWQRARQNYKTRAFFDSKTQAEYKSRLRALAINAIRSNENADFPLSDKISLNVRFYFKRTQTRLRQIETAVRFKSTRPDLDNCLKMIGDALNSICWKDDAQIVSIDAMKLYHDLGGIPRTEIEFYEIA